MKRIMIKLGFHGFRHELAEKRRHQEILEQRRVKEASEEKLKQWMHDNGLGA